MICVFGAVICLRCCDMSDRLAERLIALPHDVLASLAARMAGASPAAARRAADSTLAEYTPIPAWAVSAIFLSPDLTINILKTLQMTDCAAACACSIWRDAWIATRPFRRVLCQTPIIGNTYSEGIGRRCAPYVNKWQTACPSAIAAHPSGEWFCFGVGLSFYIVSSKMHWRHEVRVYDGPDDVTGSIESLAVSTDRLYVCQGTRVVSYSFANGTFPVAAAVYNSDEDWHCGDMALGPNDELFVTRTNSTIMRADVLHLAAGTLAYRTTFGGDHLRAGPATCLAVVGNELYVGLEEAAQLYVFTLTGWLLRKMRGEWEEPGRLIHFDGRLYLLEYVSDIEPVDEHTVKAKRIFVLSLHGQTLQICHLSDLESSGHEIDEDDDEEEDEDDPVPFEGDWVHGMGVVGQKLLLLVSDRQARCAGRFHRGRRLCALRGL